MTKTELIAKVAEGIVENKSHTGKMLDALLLGIEGALVRGEEVTLAGFGKFTVKATAARKGRNPSTGAALDIPAKKKVVFQAQKALKEAVQ